MEITYYADILFIINFFMDFSLLCLLRMILKLKGNWRRLAGGSAVGSVLAVLFSWVWLRIIFSGRANHILLFLFWLCGAVGIGSIMLILAFSFQTAQEFLKAEAGLFFGAALAEGLMQAGVTAAGFTWGYLLFPLSCLSAAFLWKAVDKTAWNQAFYYQVTLFYQGRQVQTKGFLDTGNHLEDPLSKKPVHIADRNLLEILCPKVEKVRMIPYRTIEGGGMMMPAVFLDRIEAVQEKRRIVYEQPLVAASPQKLQIKGGCGILLHE